MFPLLSIEINHIMKTNCSLSRSFFPWQTRLSFSMFSFWCAKTKWELYWFSHWWCSILCCCCFCCCWQWSHVPMSRTWYSNQCVFRLNSMHFIDTFCINKCMISFETNWNWISTFYKSESIVESTELIVSTSQSNGTSANYQIGCK